MGVLTFGELVSWGLGDFYLVSWGFGDLTTPEAAAAFDSIAPFYRKGALRWIDATKRSPGVRAARIAEMIESLKSRTENA